MLYPPYIQKALSLLEGAGFEAFVVGGALRNALLGLQAHDWDITTSATPEEMSAVFRDFSTVTSGLKHGTLAPIIDGTPVEITTYRIDGDYHDARHPDKVTFSRCLSEDLARRDFTVNALAYNQTAGLVDLFGGQDDLRAQILRAVGNPEKRFSEDALRILRGFRFASVLGFSIEPATLAAMKACREGLLKISAERKAAELSGLLVGKNAPAVLALMSRNDILPYAAPELEAGAQDCAALGELLPDFELRAAFLMRRAPKESVDSFGESLRLSGASRRRIESLWDTRNWDFEGDERQVRRVLADRGDLFPEILDFGKARGLSTARWERAARSIRERGDCLSLSALAVSGGDLMALGFEGRQIGQVLARLFEHVLDYPEDNVRDTLLHLAET